MVYGPFQFDGGGPIASVYSLVEIRNYLIRLRMKSGKKRPCRRALRARTQ